MDPKEKLKYALEQLDKVLNGYMPTEEGKKLIGQISYLKCLTAEREKIWT